MQSFRQLIEIFHAGHRHVSRLLEAGDGGDHLLRGDRNDRQGVVAEVAGVDKLSISGFSAAPYESWLTAMVVLMLRLSELVFQFMAFMV